MSEKWKRLVLLFSAITASLIIGTVSLDFIHYPSREYYNAQVQYTKALSLDDKERIAALENSKELQYVNRLLDPLLFVELVFYIGLSYFAYRYIRLHRLSVKRSVGLTAVVFTLASLVGFILAAWIFESIAGFQIDTINTEFVVATLPLVLLMSFVVAAIAESIYKRRNSFEM